MVVTILLCIIGLVAGGISLMVLLRVTEVFEGLMEGVESYMQGSSSAVVAGLGLVVGMLHTLAGPDHLAALAPLVVGKRRSTLMAFGLGALWGSGHAVGQLIIGAVCIAINVGLLQGSVAARLEALSPMLVGGALVTLGGMGLREACRYQMSEQTIDYGSDKKGEGQFRRATFATGVLHGLSPDAILFVAPALALPRLMGVFHVAGVVVGTLLSMGCVTACLGALSRRAPKLEIISAGASSLALVLGVAIIGAELGVVSGIGH